MRHWLVAALAAALLLTGCAAGETGETKEESTVSPTAESERREDEQAILPEYRKISPEQAKERMEGEEVILLDVRTEAEFSEARIEGAILIPDYEIETAALEALEDKGATILVYCRSGRRSEGAARALVEMGYTAVYDFGGILDWPYETVSGESSQ